MVFCWARAVGVDFSIDTRTRAKTIVLFTSKRDYKEISKKLSFDIEVKLD